MPIRVLEPVLEQRKLVQHAPLSALKDTRLGIDGQHYLRKILSSPQTREPLVTAIGGAPLALAEHISNHLRKLEALRIRPVFVFSGINPPKRDRPLAQDDSTPLKRAAAWEHYEKGKFDLANSTFGDSLGTLPIDVVRAVHRLFKHRNIDFIVAPYIASAQLLYLERHPKSYIHSIYSSTDMLLFDNVDRIILDIDFDKSTFSFVSKRDICADLQLTPDQFVDLGLFCGFEFCPPLPVPDFSFKAIQDLVVRYRNGSAAIMAATNQKPAYIEAFARAKCLLKCPPVLVAEEGRVLPLPLASPAAPPAPALTAADIPNDLHEVFSHKLPDEVFFHLCRGLVAGQALNALTSGFWAEPAPLCGGETEEYRRFVQEKITEHPQSPRCVSLALVSSAINSFWAKKPVSGVYWFDPSKNYTIPHSSQATITVIERAAHWHVEAATIEEELRRQNSSTIDISLCLGATSTPALADRTRISKTPTKPLEKKDEIVANTFWRFLELRSFLTSTHHHTSHAKALLMACKASRVNDKFQEPLYMAIELLRAGVLHGGKIGLHNQSGGPTIGSDQDKACQMLVMRTMSIVPLNVKTEAWQGPLSRTLLTFNSFHRTLSRSLRTLLESIVMNMLLKTDARKPRDDYLEIALSLPFQNDTNTGMGVVWKGWTDACAHVGNQYEIGDLDRWGGFKNPREEDGENLDGVKTDAVEMLEGAFGSVKDIRHELARGARFWDAVLQAVRSLAADQAVPKEIAQEFEMANAWLTPFRP